MGSGHQARCLECAESFVVNRGGGFAFHMLRCDQCGQTRSIGFDEFDKPEDDAGVEAAAGSCECGGRFTFDAPPRCPRCRSTHIEEGPPTILYD
jgi:hypothetical protein